MYKKLITAPEVLIPVDIHTFRHTTRDIQFDLFLKLSPTNVAHVFSRNTGLDYKRLAQYIQSGVTQLHIHPSDERAFRNFISRPAEIIFLDPSTSHEKKVATLLNMTEQNMSEIFTQLHVPEETAKNTQRIVKNYVDIMLKQPATLGMILNLVAHGDYLYYHSISVAFLSLLIGKASGQFNQSTLELIGLGGFLHDIGCTRLPKEIVCSPDELSHDQWEQMRAHPKIGLTMLEDAKNLPNEVRHIVYQHHEEPGGQGYPNRLNTRSIYYPAQIVAIADCLSALISKRPFRRAYSLPEAIGILQSSGQKHNRELVNILVSILTHREPEIRSA